MPYLPLPARAQFRPRKLRGFKIARLFGIDLAVDPSWFVIIVLVTLSIHAQFDYLFGETVSPALLWPAAILEGLLFFGSVVIHELSHSLVARGKGVGVESITLFIFGGVSSLKQEPTKARDEFLISGAGPLASLVLAGLFAVVGAVLPAFSFGRYFFSWLAMTNVVLAVFNLLPGFPLDGGRVLRALVWKATGDFAKATRVACRTGSVIAYALITLGVVLLLSRGGLINSLWLILIGWFLLNAAQSSLSELETRGILTQHAVNQVMRLDCPRIPGSLSVSLFVDEYLLRSGERCFFITEGEALVGLLTLRDVRSVPRERWPELRVRDIMVPLERLSHVQPSDSLLSALEIMNREQIHQLPVIDDGRFLGVVTRDAVLRAVALDLELENSKAA